MKKLVLLRHGQSEWNLAKRFTGWMDIDLSPKGIKDAHHAGRMLGGNGLTFDIAFCSVLKRSIRTLQIVLDEMNLTEIPVIKHWRLNERHYGVLQGRDKEEAQQEFGIEQVFQWRRSYHERPPALDYGDPRHPRFDNLYAEVDPDVLPSTENLEDTLDRVVPYWEETIMPQLEQNKGVIIVSHGNCLRALRKHIDHVSDDEIMKVNVPLGVPFVYELTKDLQPINSYYLEDQSSQDNAESSGLAIR